MVSCELVEGLVEVVILTFRSYQKGHKPNVDNSKAVRNIKTENKGTSLGVNVEMMRDEIDLGPENHSPTIMELFNTYQDHIPTEENVAEFIEEKVIPPYWNMTTEQRQQFQQAQVEIFCRHHGQSDSNQLPNLGRHMLLHEKAKTAFCFAPKVGCTNLKILFYLSQGTLPSSLLFKSNEDVDNDILEVAIKRHSFIGLSLKTRQNIVQNYYKFIMYRNPVDRLLSAYRSKVEKKPLDGFGHDRPHYNWLKKTIFQYKHPHEYKKWRANRGKEKIPISFSDFVDYWLFTDGVKYDEHFQTIFTLCQPCHVRYHYYGNFDTFEHDAEVLTKHIKSDSVLLRDSYYKDGEQTSIIAPKYYGQLTQKQKKMIVIRLARDLSFYYTIFPSQRDTHKEIMGINFDIPPFN